LKDRRTGNNQYLKEMNKSIVLDLIRTNKDMSRKFLADRTGLSATATGAIVKTLLNDEYIQEIGEGVSSGGRKPVILRLKPRSYYSVGFDIDERYIYTVVLDITGEVVYRKKLETPKRLTADETIETLYQAYFQAVNELVIRDDRILGVGVSIPGMMDIETKRIILAPNLGWSDVDLLNPLEEALDTTVYLDNEAMCSASCENWIGLCRNVEDFICINIESGIGAGMFVRGKIYRGFTGSAGEVGHISVDDKGLVCKCGNVGCLETIASINGMVAKAMRGSTSIQNEINVEKAFEELLQKARRGDSRSLEIFQEAAESLGKAIANLINTFNPQKIVLGKKFPDYADLVLETIRKTAQRLALSYPSRHVEIVSSPFGEDSSALGAAIIPLRKLFGK
jgi:predicted NBD/HSP70 family sugar kinase